MLIGELALPVRCRSDDDLGPLRRFVELCRHGLGGEFAEAGSKRFVVLRLEPEYRDLEQLRVEVPLEELRILVRNVSQALSRFEDRLEQDVRRGMRFARHRDPKLPARGERPLDS